MGILVRLPHIIILIALTACSVIPGRTPAETTVAGPDKDGELIIQPGDELASSRTEHADPEETRYEIIHPPVDLLDRSIEEAAALLADPATVEEGVWVMLSGLKLGVYSGDGIQVLAGSETSHKDLWLLDHSIAGLARLANGPSRSFLSFHEALAADGLEIEADGLRVFYLSALKANPDIPMSRLLTALGLDFNRELEEIELSPLEMWLLLLALMPPNPQVNETPHNATISRPLPLAYLAFQMPLELLRSDDMCAGVSGSGGPSGWSVAGDLLSEGYDSASGAVLDEMLNMIPQGARTTFNAMKRWISRFAKILEAITVTAALDSISTQLTVEPASTRRLQDREPDGTMAVVLTATVTSTHVPPIRCGPLTGTELPGGPLQGARVRFDIDSFLRRHGHIRTPGTGAYFHLTDETGSVQVRYETKRDNPPDAHRRSPKQTDSGKVTAKFDSLLHALGESFNLFASVEIVAGAFGVFDKESTVQVSWHEELNARVLDTVRTAYGDLIQLDLYSCDGPRGTWQGTINMMDFWDIPWTQEISFTFPDEFQDAQVSWTTGPEAAMLDGERFYDPDFIFTWDYLVVYDDQVEPPRLKFEGALMLEIVGLAETTEDTSFNVPVILGEDPRCGP
jgi:hypothetical protein